MHKLIDFACDELEQLEKKAEKGGLSMSEIQYADTLAHMKKNLLKGEMLMDESEYSGDYYNEDGMSHRYNGRSYARGRGANARRDSMGRYSSRDRYSREYSGNMDEETKHDIKRLVEKLDSM